MRRVGGELALGGDEHVEPADHGVEGARQLVHLRRAPRPRPTRAARSPASRRASASRRSVRGRVTQRASHIPATGDDRSTISATPAEQQPVAPDVGVDSAVGKVMRTAPSTRPPDATGTATEQGGSPRVSEKRSPLATSPARASAISGREAEKCAPEPGAVSESAISRPARRPPRRGRRCRPRSGGRSSRGRGALRRGVGHRVARPAQASVKASRSTRALRSRRWLSAKVMPERDHQREQQDRRPAPGRCRPAAGSLGIPQAEADAAGRSRSRPGRRACAAGPRRGRRWSWATRTTRRPRPRGRSAPARPPRPGRDASSGEQVELLRRQRRARARPGAPAGRARRPRAARRPASSAGPPGAPSLRRDDRADAREQLAEAERLHHVVVGADLEADHDVDLLARAR